MSKKASLIYKLITTITLFVPLPLYLFLSATLFNITPDYTIHAKIDTISVYQVEDEYFITSNDKMAIFDGLVTYNEDYDTFGIYITSDNIVKIDGKYYSYVENSAEDKTMVLKDIKVFKIQEKQSLNIPIITIVSGISVFIVYLIIQGKMGWAKKYPRTAVLSALTTGTLILFIIDFIIGGMLNVFLVATVSWALYCLEFTVKENLLDKKDATKIESDLLRTLKDALKD